MNRMNEQIANVWSFPECCFSLFPVLIQWLLLQWWKSWPVFQPWRQERWEEIFQTSTHLGMFLLFMFLENILFPLLQAELWEDMCPRPGSIGDTVFRKLRRYSQCYQQPPVFLTPRSEVHLHTPVKPSWQMLSHHLTLKNSCLSWLSLCRHIAGKKAVADKERQTCLVQDKQEEEVQTDKRAWRGDCDWRERCFSLPVPSSGKDPALQTWVRSPASALFRRVKPRVMALTESHEGK